MRKFLLSVLIGLASAGSLCAQSDDTKLLEIGWHPVSYLRQFGATHWGGSISGAYMKSNRLAYVADVSFQQTRGTSQVVTAAYRFGPRIYHPVQDRFKVFAEVLAGGAHHGTKVVAVGTTNTVTPGRNGFAVAAGGGVDYSIRPWFSWRVAQVDYSLVHVAGGSSNGVRVQTGGVFRFATRK